MTVDGPDETPSEHQGRRGDRRRFEAGPGSPLDRLASLEARRARNREWVSEHLPSLSTTGALAIGWAAGLAARHAVDPPLASAIGVLAFLGSMVVLLGAGIWWTERP